MTTESLLMLLIVALPSLAVLVWFIAKKIGNRKKNSSGLSQIFKKGRRI